MKIFKFFLGYETGIVLLLITAMAIEVTVAALVEHPVDKKIINKNMSCRLNCATNLTTPVRWYFEQNGHPSMEIYRKGKLSFTTRYSINVDGHGHYDIIIWKVDNDNSGKYTCVDDDGKGTEKAEVIVEIANLVEISPNPPVVSTNENVKKDDNTSNDMFYYRDEQIIGSLPLAIAFLSGFACLFMVVIVLSWCLVRSRKKVSDVKQASIYQHIGVSKCDSKIEASLIHVYAALPVPDYVEANGVPDHPYLELKT